MDTKPDISPAEGRSDSPLIGLDRGELAAVMAEMGVSAFRTQQLWRWLYAHGARDFAEMTDLAKDFRAVLSERFDLARPQATEDLASKDGTRKWLFRLGDGREVESVFIPEPGRGTLCVSSQVGCTLSCRFCHTGTQKLVRNLTPGEIVGQVMAARDALDDWPRPENERRITNIVMMGMGEPLYNFDNVKAALTIAMDREGIAISKRKVTLSTAGVVPMMARCGEEIGVKLAVSLHAVTDELRDEIVPINRKYPLAELLRACRTYPGVKNARRITFEYVMLKGVNDSPADARELARLLKGIPSKVNLIPFNPWPGAPYQCSSPAAVERFCEIVNECGYTATIRRPRGQDIMAACGQLKSASVKARKTVDESLGRVGVSA